MDIVLYIDEHRKPWSDCVYTYADLRLRCSIMVQEQFLIYKAL